MHFCDEAKINVRAGRGGNGATSFRREKYIAMGGPDGGNGGRGGSIIFKVNKNMNTLSNYMTQKHYKADKGEQGHGRNMFGSHSEDLILEVPIGTMVTDAETGELLADLTEIGQEIVVARGGIGGKGNANFVSSKRQAPDFAELGEPGEEKELNLELKLIADVAIIGYPSVGKSTLISHISNAKPKIADYEFTTLIPNLGMVKVDDTDFVVADIPGLIEGAHEGKGLGDEFLRHIERTKILVHVVDITHENLRDEYNKINKELELYSKELAKKPQLLVFNKADASISEIIDDTKKEFKKEKPQFISAVTGEGLDMFLYKLKDKIIEFQKEEDRIIEEEKDTLDETINEHKIFRPQQQISDTRNYKVEKDGEKYIVTGKRIEQISIMTNMEQKGGVYRMHDILSKVGAYKKLEKLGARTGDKIIIGPNEFDFKDMS